MIVFIILNVDFLTFNKYNETTFSYSGQREEFKLKAGRYLFRLDGAKGGSGYSKVMSTSPQGGNGARVLGYLNLTGTETVFYAHVGGAANVKTAGFNRGGKGAGDELQYGGGGGGSTDVRIH